MYTVCGFRHCRVNRVTEYWPTKHKIFDSRIKTAPESHQSGDPLVSLLNSLSDSTSGKLSNIFLNFIKFDCSEILKDETFSPKTKLIPNY